MVRLLLGLFAYACTALRALPAHALRLGRDGSNVIGFIRIQKTGGTTWGETIMPEICPPGDRCYGYYHWDYSTANSFSHTLVTMLRDPVERVLSEFFFIRSKGFPERDFPHQRQWDFQNETFLNLVQDEPDADKALDSYLHAWPEHPSFNRQVLYLAGFKGVEKAPPFRWHNGYLQQQEFLSRAKHHLAKEIQAFGFTDCFSTSVAALARALGMNETLAVSMANSNHNRTQDKQASASKLRRHRSKGAAERAKAAGGDGFRGRWRSMMDEATVAEIERLNWADLELHSFALAEFRRRFGLECADS